MEPRKMRRRRNERSFFMAISQVMLFSSGCSTFCPPVTALYVGLRLKVGLSAERCRLKFGLMVTTGPQRLLSSCRDDDVWFFGVLNYKNMFILLS